MYNFTEENAWDNILAGGNAWVKRLGMSTNDRWYYFTNLGGLIDNTKTALHMPSAKDVSTQEQKRFVKTSNKC